MDASELDTAHVSRRPRRFGPLAALAMMLAAAIGLTACGGSSTTKSVATSLQAAVSSSQTSSQGATAATGSAPYAGNTTSTAASSAATPPTGSTTDPSKASTPGNRRGRSSAGTIKTTHGKRPTRTTTGSANGPTSTAPGTSTTIAGNSASPAYTGPSPLGCLTAAGLDRARPAREPQVWEANFGQTPDTDSNAIVFLSGPYKDDATATQYAQSLTVVEVAASGGRWVASAALHSGLNAAVDQAASCMGG